MTEEQLALIERLLNTPVQDAEAFAGSIAKSVAFVPELIAEIRKLRAMRALGVTIPPDPSDAESEVMTAEGVQAVVRDLGEMIGECCSEGAAFLLTLFDTRGDCEPVYVFNADRGDTVKALRRVIELVEQS